MKSLAILVLLTSSLISAQTRPFFAASDAVRPLDVAISPLAEEPQSGGERKNVATAALYSFLLPGMGELYAGDYSLGKYLTILEGGLVVSLIGFDRYANWLQDDARTFARTHSGSAVDGKDDRYFNAIGDFNDIYAYNEEVLRQRSPEDVYNPQTDYFWKWDDPANRSTYRDMKVTSDERFNDTRFIAAAIIVNHLVSAVNAARTAIAHNKAIDQASLLELHADVLGGLASPQGIRLTLSHRF